MEIDHEWNIKINIIVFLLLVILTLDSLGVLQWSEELFSEKEQVIVEVEESFSCGSEASDTCNIFRFKSFKTYRYLDAKCIYSCKDKLLLLENNRSYWIKILRLPIVNDRILDIGFEKWGF